MKPWSSLPNAAHIDRILDDVKRRPEVWIAAWDAAWDAALGATRDAALGATRDAARGAARVAAWGAVRDAARDAARVAALDAAWVACFALIEWDDAADVLSLPTDAVRLLAACGDHRAVLLLPASIALAP